MSTAEQGRILETDLTAFERAVELLDPAPHPLETGVARTSAGVLSVNARTDMPGCKGRMLEWWFRFACDTDQYKWWHPLDHVSSRWVETSPRTHIGSTHIVQERLGDADPTVHDLHIHFVDPVEIFGDAYTDALESGDVSGCVAAMTGEGAEPIRDERGRPDMGRMAHICRDTDEGMVLRSRFWLGAGTNPPPAEVLRAHLPDAMGLGLMQHATTEFKYLSKVLPGLFYGANAETEHVPRMW